MLAYILKQNLDSVKRKMGSECTYLSFEKSKYFNEKTNEWEEANFFHGKVKNNLGGKSTVRVKINVGLEKLVSSDYDNLYNTLKEKQNVS